MIIGIDHVLIAVDDLEHAIETYRKLGFQVLRGGEHPRFGTHNGLVPLADGAYLELIGVKNQALAEQFPHTQRIVQALKRENRLAAFALDSDDLEKDVEAIRARGLTIHDPIAGERIRPDGQRVAWRTAHSEDPRLPFLIEDETPREIRIPPPSEGIGCALRLAHLKIRARHVETLYMAFERLLGLNSAEGRFPMARGEIRGGRGDSESEISCLALAADDLDAIMSEWGARGVPFREQMMSEFGRALLPTETAGAPIVVLRANASARC